MIAAVIDYEMQESPIRFGPQEWRFAYAIAFRVLKRRDLAEDAAQDALLKAYAARDSFRSQAKPQSWLYRITHNTAISYLRSAYARHYTDSTDDEDSEVLNRNHRVQGDDTPESRACANVLARELGRCLETMRPKDRLAFTARYVDGCDERELGRILGVSPNAAKQRAFRARRLVQQELHQFQGAVM